MKKLSILILLMIWAFSVHAQDVIILKNGNQINAKVTEINSSEIKYKRYDNPDGPTVVMDKSDVSAINYENGTREVFNTVAASAPSTTARTPAPSFAIDPAKPTFGIYANPIGFLTFGTMIGAELTAGKFIGEINFRFPTMGLLMPLITASREITMDGGIGVGIGGKFYNAKPRGGFYVGGFLEYWTDTFSYLDGSEDTGESNGFVLGANIGYKFQFKSGLYLRTGGYLGTSYTTKFDLHTSYGVEDWSGDIYPFGLVDLAIGINF